MTASKVIEAAAPWLAILSIATVAMLLLYEFALTLPEGDAVRERAEHWRTGVVVLAVIVLVLNGVRVAALIGYIQ